MFKDKITAYVALGSNLGDRYAHLDAAQSAVARAQGVYLDQTSPTYESPAVELAAQPPFLNRVLALNVWFTPRELLAMCQDIERRLGREPTVPKGPRVIDVDILLFGAATVNEPDLVIPHAALARRPFFLQPLKDVAGDIIAPGFNLPLSRLLGALAPYELTLYPSP
jgi:2-amino-4-hydroxy-6-hydroxymethyldihydropteridine diphosphokinase